MRIAQLLLDTAPWFERKSQQLDLLALSGEHQMTTLLARGNGVVVEGSPSPLGSVAEIVAGLRADVLHVYGPAEIPPLPLRRVAVPWVASGTARRTSVPWRRAPARSASVSPLASPAVPEAVNPRYLQEGEPPMPRPRGGRWNVGSCLPGRPKVRFLCEATMTRLSRFRDDLDWLIFDDVPSPEELDEVAVWVDPAVDEADLDGFGAEALAAGLPVIAARTAINRLRLENGASGFLVPPDDPNELAHAILAALFRPELARPKVMHARETISRFDPSHRARVLAALYERLVR